MATIADLYETRLAAQERYRQLVTALHESSDVFSDEEVDEILRGVQFNHRTLKRDVKSLHAIEAHRAVLRHAVEERNALDASAVYAQLEAIGWKALEDCTHPAPGAEALRVKIKAMRELDLRIERLRSVVERVTREMRLGMNQRFAGEPRRYRH